MAQSVSLFAVVRFAVEGFHHWPAAPPPRAYLAARHRHLFHVEVKLAESHDEREVEFHDLLDFCRASFPGGEMGAASCEMMAESLGKKITARWPGRSVEVFVCEDGEAGGSALFS